MEGRKWAPRKEVRFFSGYVYDGTRSNGAYDHVARALVPFRGAFGSKGVRGRGSSTCRGGEERGVEQRHFCEVTVHGVS